MLYLCAIDNFEFLFIQPMFKINAVANNFFKPFGSQLTPNCNFSHLLRYKYKYTDAKANTCLNFATGLSELYLIIAYCYFREMPFSILIIKALWPESITYTYAYG